MTDKPLHRRPDFNALVYADIEKNLDEILLQTRQRISALEKIESPTWNNLMDVLEALENTIDLFWSPVSHLNSVLNSDELRQAYNACLPKLSEFNTEVGQNKKLYELTLALQQSDEFDSLSAAQKKIISNSVRDYKLSGVSLDDNDKERFKTLTLRLSEIQTKFSENILDSTNEWQKQINDVAELQGLPDHAIAAAKERAEKKAMQGWLLNLDFPTYYAVMTFADSAELRAEMYEAFATRASDQGPHNKQYDNSTILNEILSLRAEKAQLLGFDNYAQLSVVSKMVESPQQVTGFLQELATKSLPAAKADMQELKQFVADTYNVSELHAWDIGYYSDKLKKAKYDISEEELKPYFPANVAIPGMFKVVGRLFGLQIEKIDGVSVWHDDVDFYQIKDAQGKIRGEFYQDTYARENKRGGAWMDVCVSRRRIGNDIQIPIAYLTCNLTPPVGDVPALLTHNEVTTLFHEFGHGLHHMLTLVDYAGVSGISGVEWDAVELPSQFLENWCWEREALDLISAHYETGKPLPDELLDRAQAARNFQSAMQMVRQIEFATFDMNLHIAAGTSTDFNDDKGIDVQSTLDAVREQVSVIPTPAFNRFQHAFSHIFAGGYAAGYFSYKWAEVLSADAFAKFEEDGIFNENTGKAFMENILEKGGTDPAMQLFTAFRGREPSIDALLRHSGLAA